MATTRGSESRKGGQLSGDRMGVLMVIWRPRRGSRITLFNEKSVIKGCEYIYGSGQKGKGTLAGDHMLRDETRGRVWRVVVTGLGPPAVYAPLC